MRLFEDSHYRRLPGASRSSTGAVQYWQGADHVLLVEVVWLVERYRRFDFKDMVALTIRRTRRHWWVSLACGVLALVLAGLGGFIWTSDSDPGSLAFAAGFFLVALALVGTVIWTLTRGISCEVRLTTSVQTLVLPGLRTVRGARRFREALLAHMPSEAFPPAPAGSEPATPGNPELRPASEPGGSPAGGER